MKSVLISIQPKWCELIAIGKKTIEVRKTAPKDKESFKVYIYQTKKKWIYRLLEKLGLYRGKIIGEFVCDRIDKIKPLYEFYREIGYDLNDDQQAETCLTRDELKSYGKGNPLYGLHISDLKIYNNPKELGEFNYPCPKPKNGCGDCLEHGPYGWDFDEKSKKIYCTRRLKCPPQSWCYVE